MIAAGALCCSKDRREWAVKFLHVDDLLAAVKAAASSEELYGWDGSYKSMANKPLPGIYTSLTDADRERLRNMNKLDLAMRQAKTNMQYPDNRHKTVFTNLSHEDRAKLDQMKDDFFKLKSSGKLLPCRLDDGDDCFAKPSAIEYATKFLRSGTAGDMTDGRTVLHNPLKEGMKMLKS